MFTFNHEAGKACIRPECVMAIFDCRLGDGRRAVAVALTGDLTFNLDPETYTVDQLVEQLRGCTLGPRVDHSKGDLLDQAMAIADVVQSRRKG